MKDKFYIGAKVLCVKSQENGVTSKGKIYEVEGIKKCACGGIDLDFGLANPRTHIQCCLCNKFYPSSICWQSATRFRLIEPDTELSEVEVNELLDELLKEHSHETL